MIKIFKDIGNEISKVLQQQCKNSDERPKHKRKSLKWGEEQNIKSQLQSFTAKTFKKISHSE